MGCSSSASSARSLYSHSDHSTEVPHWANATDADEDDEWEWGSVAPQEDEDDLRHEINNFIQTTEEEWDVDDGVDPIDNDINDPNTIGPEDGPRTQDPIYQFCPRPIGSLFSAFLPSTLANTHFSPTDTVKLAHRRKFVVTQSKKCIGTAK